MILGLHHDYLMIDSVYKSMILDCLLSP